MTASTTYFFIMMQATSTLLMKANFKAVEYTEGKKLETRTMKIEIVRLLLPNLFQFAIVMNSRTTFMTRLAAFISRAMCFQISLTKQYNSNSLMDDIRIIYKNAGHNANRQYFYLLKL